MKALKVSLTLPDSVHKQDGSNNAALSAGVCALCARVCALVCSALWVHCTRACVHACACVCVHVHMCDTGRECV